MMSLKNCALNKLQNYLKNPFIVITLFALFLQSIMLILFYALPDPLGLSLLDMFSGKILWQIFMAYGGILVLVSIFAFFKKPRFLAVLLLFYFLLAIFDYEVFRFSHQRLSYSFLRTYFHVSNITDSTTLSTLGGDFKATISWLFLAFLNLGGFISLIIFYSFDKFKQQISFSKKFPFTLFIVGLILSITPLILFLTGTRGVITVPVIQAQIDMRFSLGKHTLTAPILHIAAVETFEFVRDNHKITDELIEDFNTFLPKDFPENRIDKNFPAYRKATAKPYKAQKPYNILFVFGESYKSRVFNQMLDGDTLLAPHLWNLAQGKYYENGGGALWFKNAFSGGYPTVRGTMATYFGFPSHPNRDVPSFYASNHFKGFPEYLDGYKKAYMTISNPIFDHTLPFVERFFGDNWRFIPEVKKPGTADSLGANLVLELLNEMPTDSSWLLVYNTICTHIPFFNYPDDFADKPDDPMQRYRNAVRYIDNQFARILEVLTKREDFERTVIVILGDHDTPVDSIDRKVPQPIGVSASEIFMGIFAADSNLINGFTIRDDVASQLDIAPTILDLAQIKKPHHFWGFDLLTEERPADTPALFYSENGYYLGFRDFVLTGGLKTDDIYRGEKGNFHLVEDEFSKLWKSRAENTSKVLRSLLRNDNMIPQE